MREPLIHLHLTAEGLWGLEMGFSCPEQMSWWCIRPSPGREGDFPTSPKPPAAVSVH